MKSTLVPDLGFVRGKSDNLDNSHTVIKPKNDRGSTPNSKAKSVTSIGKTSQESRPNKLDTRKSFNRSRKNEVELMVLVETMKEKYMKNIEVIGSLFDEKKSMERRIGILERQLQRYSRRSGVSGHRNNNDEDVMNEDQEDDNNHDGPESQSYPDNYIDGDNAR
jgi:hypothetical protein